jgi:hypothetical protein
VRRVEALERRTRANDLIGHHIADESWQRLLLQAREAAGHSVHDLICLSLHGRGSLDLDQCSSPVPANNGRTGGDSHLEYMVAAITHTMHTEAECSSKLELMSPVALVVGSHDRWQRFQSAERCVVPASPIRGWRCASPT